MQANGHRVSEAQIKALRLIQESGWRGVPMERGGGVGFSHPTALALQRAGLIDRKLDAVGRYGDQPHGYFRCYITAEGLAFLRTLGAK